MSEDSEIKAPSVDKLSVRLPENLKEIESRLGSRDKICFMIDLRHVGVSNDTTFLEVVDDHIAAFNHIFNQHFESAGIPFQLSRIGGDEFMGFVPNTPEAIAVFNRALQAIEGARLNHFEGNPSIQESGLLEQTAVRSFARSFLKRCQEATGQASPTIDELWEATQQEAIAQKHEEVTQTSREAYGTLPATSQNAEFYKAVLLAVLHRQITEADLGARDFESRYEDKPLSLSVVAISTQQSLTPETMGQLATQAEAELSRAKKETTKLLHATEDPHLEIKVLEAKPPNTINDEWSEETNRAKALQAHLDEVESMDDLAPEQKQTLIEHLQALDPSLSIDRGDEQPLRALLLDEVAGWPIERLFESEEIGCLSATTIDIGGFGAINNHYGYQVADKLLHDVVHKYLQSIQPHLTGLKRVQLVRQGGGKVHVLCSFNTPSQQARFRRFLAANQTNLSQDLSDQLASYYQNPTVLAEITQKMVSSILRFDEEEFIENLTTQTTPPRVAVSSVATEASTANNIGSWLSPPSPAADISYKTTAS